MEDSPEEILARLIRYRDSVRAREAAAPGAAPRSASGVAGPSAVATATRPATRAIAATAAPRAPSAPASPRTIEPVGTREAAPAETAAPLLNAVEATLLGQLLATVAGVLGILAFERFAGTTAVLVVGAMAVVGVAAAWRRIPLSLWWTTGVVIGGVLGRWS